MVHKWRLNLTDNSNQVKLMGNEASRELVMNRCTIKKDGRIGTATIEIDNKNSRYDNEFENFNNFEFFFKNGLDSVEDDVEMPKRFAGQVLETTPSADNTKITLTCQDWNGKLAKRTWTGVRRDIDLGQLIYDIMVEKFPEFDPTQINVNTGIVLDEYRSDARYVNAILNDLFKENTYECYVDYDKIVRLFDTNQGSTGIVLYSGDQGNVIQKSINLKKSNLSNYNSVTVIGGSELIKDHPEEFTYKGFSKTLILGNIADKINTMKINNIVIPEDDWGNYWEFGSDKKTIIIKAELQIDDEIEFIYDYRNSIWCRETELGETDLRELVIKDSSILTLKRAEAIAKTTLAKQNITQIKGTCASDKITEDFLPFQTLELGYVNGFKGVQNIKAYQEEISAADYIVTFTLEQVFDENTRMIINLMNELDKLKSKDSSTVTIRDGFNINEILNLVEETTATQKGQGNRFILNSQNNSKINSSRVKLNGAYGPESEFNL